MLETALIVWDSTRKSCATSGETRIHVCSKEKRGPPQPWEPIFANSKMSRKIKNSGANSTQFRENNPAQDSII